jgi:Skp family chaperone for outer membrane proteins
LKNRHPRAALVALALFAAAGSLAAQEATKIGLVNSQDILDKSVEGKKALAQLQEADKKYQAELVRLDDQIKQLQTRLTAQRLTLAAEAAAAIQADIQKKQTDRQRMAEDASRAMQELQYKVLTRVQGELIAIIDQIRKDRGLDLVFDLTKSGAAYASPALDLTAEVLRRYDASKGAPPAKK